MLGKLVHAFRSEEKRLSLGSGPEVRRFLESYHRLRPHCSELGLRNLEQVHQEMCSSLHRGADAPEVNASAFLYACNRLPACMPQTGKVILASSLSALESNMKTDLHDWQLVRAQKRRRTAYFNGEQTLAVLVTSVSDLDDIIPGLCAYQIEWNKMHRRLKQSPLGPELALGRASASALGTEVRQVLGLNRADYETLQGLWGRDWDRKIAAMAGKEKDLLLCNLPMLDEDFQEIARIWWDELLRIFEVYDLPNRPVYLVTSNNHSLVNLSLGFAARHKKEILTCARGMEDPEFVGSFDRVLAEDPDSLFNFLYYAQPFFVRQNPGLAEIVLRMERESGIQRTAALEPLLAEAQVIELDKLRPRRLDPRLGLARPEALARSRAVILNTDYPLGFGAYHLLQNAGERLQQWRGLFVLGKSAAMIGRLGDILIPTQVRDVHFERLYSFQNCFSARNLAPYLHEAAVFDDQRSLTVHGTFLHSWDAVRGLHRADFTGIEMEAGPCLAALADHFPARSTQSSGCVDLKLPPDFHLGFLHYASDTPYNLRASLLSRPLGLSGLEATYACSLAILQYILDQEAGQLGRPLERGR